MSTSVNLQMSGEKSSCRKENPKSISKDTDIKSGLNRIAENFGGASKKDLLEAAKVYEKEGKTAEASLLRKLAKEKFFGKADKNGDGILDAKEIKKLSSRDGDKFDISLQDLRNLKKGVTVDKVKREKEWEIKLPFGFKMIKMEGLIKYFIPKGLEKNQLAKVSNILNRMGLKDQAKLFKKLSKDHIFEKADLNKDGKIDYSEMKYLAGYDGNDDISLEDVKRMKKGAPHILEELGKIRDPKEKDDKKQKPPGLKELPEDTNILSILEQMTKGKCNKGTTREELKKVADYLRKNGKEDEANMLEKLAKNKFFKKVDSNGDGRLSAEEISHVSGFDGDDSDLSPEDLIRMSKGKDHLLDGIEDLLQAQYQGSKKALDIAA